ncbi:putative DNA-binding domain-containing protein [Sinobacterium caligoides]|nr:putative DNA-binding domain-containing protein [Sinobacterium caligoides]
MNQNECVSNNNIKLIDLITLLATTTVPGAKTTPLDNLPIRSGSVEVYRQCNHQALYSCLTDSYPLSYHWLGEQAFYQLCNDFIHTHNSDHWDLNQYPLGFRQYLKRQQPTLDQRKGLDAHRQLTCIAEVDATLHAYYYGYPFPLPPHNGAPSLNLERLAKLGAEQLQSLRFTAQPQMRLLMIDDAVSDFIQQHKSIDRSLLTQAQARRLVVSRQGLHNQLCFVEDDFYYFLQQLISGQPLVHCLDDLAQTPFAKSLKPNALLIALERGWLIDYDSDEAENNNSPQLPHTLPHRKN